MAARKGESEMSIERIRTLVGNALYQVWDGNNLLATFESYCDAVDFYRFLTELDYVPR